MLAAAGMQQHECKQQQGPWPAGTPPTIVRPTTGTIRKVGKQTTALAPGSHQATPKKLATAKRAATAETPQYRNSINSSSASNRRNTMYNSKKTGTSIGRTRATAGTPVREDEKKYK